MTRKAQMQPLLLMNFEGYSGNGSAFNTYNSGANSYVIGGSQDGRPQSVEGGVPQQSSTPSSIGAYDNANNSSNQVKYHTQFSNLRYKTYYPVNRACKGLVL